MSDESENTKDKETVASQEADLAYNEDDGPEGVGEVTENADDKTMVTDMAEEKCDKEEEHKTPEEKISDLEIEAASLNDRLLRAMAETENIRRRSQREKQDTARYSIANFARNLLSVADNLGRALASIDEEAREQNGAIENLMVGVEMTERELMTVLEQMGVTRMEPVGTRFDPNVHEAMFEYEDTSQPAGMVGQVIEPGYAIHERTLRPAKVGITKGGPKVDPEPATDASSGAPSERVKDGAKASVYGVEGEAAGETVDEEL